MDITALLGLVMIVGQIFGAVRLFGGAKQSPYWLDVSTGICLVFMLIALIGLSK